MAVEAILQQEQEGTERARNVTEAHSEKVLHIVGEASKLVPKPYQSREV